MIGKVLNFANHIPQLIYCLCASMIKNNAPAAKRILNARPGALRNASVPRYSFQNQLLPS